MRKGIVITVVAVAALGAGAALLWSGARADAETTTDPVALICDSESAVDCSGCPGHASAVEPQESADCDHIQNGCPAADGDHGCAELADSHHADANCPCGGDRAACTDEMKAVCDHRANCDYSSDTR
jgi:hypothetical protein